MMSALDAIKAINAARDDAIVVGTMTPNRYWDAVSEKPDLDLPVFGAMGKASSGVKHETHPRKGAPSR